MLVYGVNETIDETATLKQGRDPDYRPPNLAHIGRDDLNAADPRTIPDAAQVGIWGTHEHNPRLLIGLVLVYLVMSILCSESTTPRATILASWEVSARRLAEHAERPIDLFEVSIIKWSRAFIEIYRQAHSPALFAVCTLCPSLIRCDPH